MPRRSSLEQLPRELVDTCHRLIRDGHTIASIADKLNELGADVSQSAVGRYVKTQRELMERYRAAQEIAAKVMEQWGEVPNGDVNALLAEMLKTLAFQSMSQIGEDDAKIKPGELMFLAKAVKDAISSSKMSFEHQQRVRKAAIDEAASTVGTAAKREGLSAAAIERIQQELKLL